MREFDIRRGHFKKLGGSLGIRSVMEELFGPVKDAQDGVFESSYGAMRWIRVRVISPERIAVETESDPDVAATVAAETRQRYNTFMERATGFTAKQRMKRLQTKAKKGGL